MRKVVRSAQRERNYLYVARRIVCGRSARRIDCGELVGGGRLLRLSLAYGGGL